MARAEAAFKIRGRVHNLIFKVQNDRQVVYLAPEDKPERHKERMHKHIAYRLNILEFGMASTMAISMYRFLRPCETAGFGPIMRPYAQNHLTAVLKKAAERHNKRALAADPAKRHSYWYGTSIRMTDIAPALTGLDLGHEEAPTEMVKMQPLGPLHNPTAIRITGLDQAAKAIATHGNAQLECRLMIRQARFQERVLTPDGFNHETWEEAHNLPLPASSWEYKKSAPTDWIPAQILPTEGLLLELPKVPEGVNYVSAIHIEWREIRTVGRRIVKHHKMGICRIATVHGPAEAFTPPKLDPYFGPEAAQDTSPTNPNQEENSIEDHQKDWQSDPKAYLEKALGRLKPK